MARGNVRLAGGRHFAEYSFVGIREVSDGETGVK